MRRDTPDVRLWSSLVVRTSRRRARIRPARLRPPRAWRRTSPRAVPTGSPCGRPSRTPPWRGWAARPGGRPLPRERPREPDMNAGNTPDRVLATALAGFDPAPMVIMAAALGAGVRRRHIMGAPPSCWEGPPRGRGPHASRGPSPAERGLVGPGRHGGTAAWVEVGLAVVVGVTRCGGPLRRRARGEPTRRSPPEPVGPVRDVTGVRGDRGARHPVLISTWRCPASQPRRGWSSDGWQGREPDRPDRPGPCLPCRPSLHGHAGARGQPSLRGPGSRWSSLPCRTGVPADAAGRRSVPWAGRFLIQ
ncbi:hypothetical protein QJS66_14540 [Kocuria rhizophila]|nr:hypothetical protein QJS66_14540 [Kocuria rhizophila]